MGKPKQVRNMRMNYQYDFPNPIEAEQNELDDLGFDVACVVEEYLNNWFVERQEKRNKRKLKLVNPDAGH